jgi:secreted trypsin-like serine protease
MPISSCGYRILVRILEQGRVTLRRLIAFAATAIAALALAGSASPLIGGSPTGTSQYTNVGAFGVVINGEFFEVCSGTLIEPNVVLTAGHCTVFFEALETRATNPLNVVFTLHPSPTASSTFYDAIEFFTHPDYVDELRGNSKCGLFGQCTTDVGLVELATASSVAPAELAPLDYVDTLDLKTQLFTIVGYGVEGFANANTALGPNGGTRKFGTFQAIPGQDVTSDLFLKLSGRQFDTGTCFGDSGGPVFAEGYLVAVVSFGQSWVCASMGYYTRVDVESVSTWIATTIAEINSD